MTTENSDLTKTVDSVDYLFFSLPKMHCKLDRNRRKQKRQKIHVHQILQQKKCFRMKTRYLPNVFLDHLKNHNKYCAQYSIEKELQLY